MSILDWYRRTFVPLRRDDPRFGRMLFQRMSGKYGPSYWECSGTFAGQEVEYFVDAEEAGPNDVQREHVRLLEARWKEIEPRLERFLAQRQGSEELGDFSARLSDWSLGSLTLRADPRVGRGVEIGYVEVDGGELMTFEIEGLEPRAVRVGD